MGPQAITTGSNPDPARPADKPPTAAFASTEATFGTAGVNSSDAHTEYPAADPDMLIHQRRQASPRHQMPVIEVAWTFARQQTHLRGVFPRFGIWKLRQVTVRIDRRAYSPVLRQASLPPDTTVPWWPGYRLHFEFS